VPFQDEEKFPAASADGGQQAEQTGADSALAPASEPVAEVPARPAKLVPEDLRAPWGWLDLLLFLGITVLATFALGIVLVVALSALGRNLMELRTSPRVGGIAGIVYEVALFALVLGCIALYLRLRYGTPFWRTVGWRPLEAGRYPEALVYASFIGGGFLLAFVVQLLSAYFGTNAKLPMEALFRDRLVALLLLLMAVLVAPVVEETFFRGLLYPVVARSFGRGVGIVVTGTLFGLMHAAQLWGGWTQIALLVAVGIILTYARAVKRTVLASFLLHFSYNLAISLAFLIFSHGLRVLPKGS